MCHFKEAHTQECIRGGYMYYDMSEKELWQEDVWYHIQVGDYVEYNGIVYDYETGTMICTMADLYN